MSGTKRSFAVIGEQEIAPPEAPPDKTSTFAAVNAQMLLLSLRALSQRTLTAVTNLFTLILVASVWALLWWQVLPDPSLRQIGACGGYAAFVLLIDIVRRRK